MINLSIVECAKLRHAARSVFYNADDNGAFFSQQFLRAKNFCSVLFEGDFRDTDRIISSLCLKSKIENLVCGSISDHREDCYVLNASHSQLRLVREHYPDPSYFITDHFEKLVIISDSDYFWGLAATKEDIEKAFRISVSHILDTYRTDIQPFLDSSDSHDVRLGSMLQKFLQVCDDALNRTR